MSEDDPARGTGASGLALTVIGPDPPQADLAPPVERVAALRAGEWVADRREARADRRQETADLRDEDADLREEIANRRHEAANLRQEIAALGKDAMSLVRNADTAMYADVGLPARSCAATRTGAGRRVHFPAGWRTP
jgi:hypothetical protein